MTIFRSPSPTPSCSLDPARRTARRDGVELALSSRELSVLEFLLRRQGTVVSKTELLEHCWDTAFDGDPATVEVHIHRLRRKIDPPTGAPTIHTVRGEGYRINPTPDPQ